MTLHPLKLCAALLLGVGSALLQGCITAPTGSGSSATVPPPATTTAAIEPKPVVLGLALGGGAARGFAHIGVIQVLEDAGIRPHLVVGTSAGSLVAAAYATGSNGAALQRMAEHMDESAITDWTLPFINRGVLRGDAYTKYVASVVNNRTIEQATTPLGIVATELETGRGILFRRGDIATAVRASSAVPGVFEPVRIAGLDYVDGGLVSPVPVRYARQMGATVVVGVDISKNPAVESADGSLQILLKTFTIMGKSINDFELKSADVVVRPSLAGVGSADFTAKRRAIEAGRAAMQQALPQLRQLLESPRP